MHLSWNAESAFNPEREFLDIRKLDKGTLAIYAWDPHPKQTFARQQINSPSRNSSSSILATLSEASRIASSKVLLNISYCPIPLTRVSIMSTRNQQRIERKLQLFI